MNPLVGLKVLLAAKNLVAAGARKRLPAAMGPLGVGAPIAGACEPLVAVLAGVAADSSVVVNVLKQRPAACKSSAAACPLAGGVWCHGE